MGAVVGKNLGGILYLMAGFPSNEHKNYMELHMVGNTTLRQRSIKGKSGPTAFLPNLFQTVEILEVQGAWGKRKRSPVWLIQPQVTEYGPNRVHMKVQRYHKQGGITRHSEMVNNFLWVTTGTIWQLCSQEILPYPGSSLPVGSSQVVLWQRTPLPMLET